MSCRGISITATLLFALSAVPLCGQEFRSTISGRVTDTQQAVVPGAKVVCTNAETGAKFETTSAADGAYAVPLLPPGTYTLSASSHGFKAYQRTGVKVSTNEREQVDIVLVVGDVVETVTVTSEASLIETATASTGQVIDSKLMDLTPSNGRTPLVLAQLAVGVTTTSSPRFVRPFDNANSSAISMGGGQATTNELLLDGAPNVGSAGAVAFNPPMDAVTEVKVESFQADAASGHTGSGTVNVLLKNGTNTLHGSAYEYNQNTALAATSWFLNATGQPKAASSQYNQWGATAGGPVFIPKVYDGRNKIFFFFAYEGVRHTLPRPQATNVPTDAERSGDFSSMLNIGSQYTIYDPSTGVKNGSRIQRTPFPNNTIPSSRINTIAKNLTQFFPEPNSPTQANGTNNYMAPQVEANTFHSILLRADFNLSTKNKIYVNLRNNARNQTMDLFHNLSTGYTQQRINWGGMIEDIATLSPSTVLDVRANYTRYYVPTTAAASGYDITKLGFPSALANAALAPKLPYVYFSQITGFGSIGDSQAANETYQIFSTVTKMVRNHTIKVGADLRQYRNSSNNLGNTTGSYYFDSSWTNGPVDNSTSAPMGQDYAGFLLGLPTSGSLSINASNIYQAGYYSIFVQDDIRVRSDLTVNIGLRFERDLPSVERFNRAVNGFDTTTSSTIAAAAQAAYAKSPVAQLPASQFQVKGGLLFANSNARSMYDTQSNNFSPRFGFAWKPKQLGGRTVIRGGVGVYYSPLGATGLIQTGFTQTTTLVATNDSYLTPATTLSNPFPSGILQPVGSAQGLATYLGQGISYYDRQALNPYSVRWTFNVQRALPGNVNVQLGYQGNHALNLGTTGTLDYTPSQFLSTSPTRDQTTINTLSSLVANPFAGLLPGTTMNGSTIALSSLLTAYPQFSSVTEYGMNEGNSYFHQGTFQVEKRFNKGFSLMGNYGLSKMLTRLSRLNSSDLQLAKRVASEDRPQRLVINSTYELPFGKGKAIASHVPSLVNGIIGGWALSGVYLKQSGAALSWGNLIFYGGDIHLNARAVNGAFDVTKFNRVSSQQLSQNIRTFPLTFGNLRADGANTFDFSAIKQFKIYERLGLQFRCEWFNALNHATFSAPSLSATSSAFSTISSVDNIPRAIQMALRLTW